MLDRTRSAEALVAADIAHVWDVITDLPRMARWSPEIKDSRWTSRRRVAAISTGDQMESRISLGDFGWSSVATIMRVNPPRSLVFEVGDHEAPVASWTYVLSVENASTRVRHTVVLGSGYSIVAAVAGPDRVALTSAEQARLDRLRDGMVQTLTRLKAETETGAELSQPST